MTALRVGLTGGAAAGKSTVAAAFAELGVPVYSADAIAHELTGDGAPLLDDLRREFGDAVFTPDGNLDRRALGNRVFGDEGARQRLEALLHPPIRARLRALAAGTADDYCILEIPLLLQRDLGKLVDRVLVVTAPAEERVRRLVSRDGRSETTARAVLAAQPDDATYLALADDVIDNGGDTTGLTAHIARLDRLYRDIATQGDPGRPGLHLT